MGGKWGGGGTTGSGSEPDSIGVPELIAEALKLALSVGLEVGFPEHLHPLDGKDGANEPHDAEDQTRTHDERERGAQARDDQTSLVVRCLYMYMYMCVHAYVDVYVYVYVCIHMC